VFFFFFEEQDYIFHLSYYGVGSTYRDVVEDTEYTVRPTI